MPEESGPRALLRRGFATSLRRLGLALELLAEDVVGDGDAPIDWIASSPEGRAWLVLIEPETAGPALLGTGLVQRAWVEARIPDWRQLAPGLPLRDGLVPGLLLVAREHPREARIAAREAGDAIRCVRWDGDPQAPDLFLLEAPPRSRHRAAKPAAPLRSIFRTGLTDADLAN